MIQPDIHTATSYFADTYQNARQLWNDKVSSILSGFSGTPWLSGHSGVIAHPLLSPTQTPLATDWLWIGNQRAQNIGIFFSATHGIEGYVGSAVQSYLLDYLQSNEIISGKNEALLFVHALNPWGMAWQRRCDENGVDLNRNYVNFTQPPKNPSYSLVQPWLDVAEAEQRQTALDQVAKELGQTDYEIALSGGQFTDPTGPFYGGQAPAHGHKVCEQLVKQFDLSHRRLTIIDIHSGLGAWSHGELISDHPLNNPNDRYAQQVFGPGVTNPARGDSSSVAKYGLQDYFWHKVMGDNGCYLTLEYGTYPTQALFDVIIDDHRIWRECDASAISKQQHAMRRHFCPSDVYWRQLVLVQAAQVLERMLSGFES